jgi:monoamine oxidase
MALHGVSVLVAGAGLAGLAAARDLVALGARVAVVDARERVGGRVWTLRDGFLDGQHGEGGGDLIDDSQAEIRRLAGELGLNLRPILRGSWGFARPDARGRPRLVRPGLARGWNRLQKHLSALVDRYRLAERRWDSPIVSDLARRSVADWLEESNADGELRATVLGLRGFFLADPDQLSLLAVVDQFAASEPPSAARMSRIDGGNDKLAAAMAASLNGSIRLGTELVAIGHRGRSVRASVRQHQRMSQVNCDYLVLALPATIVRRIPITPALPSQQHDAIAQLGYGRATRTLLQFSRRFWRAPGRPRAFGSSLPIGAVWEANEEQRGRSGILSLLAGGSASDETGEIVARDGPGALVSSLDWLGGKGAELLASRQVVWETEPWSRGGYAYIDPSYDPALRNWLARPCGRLFFAGEHTSVVWQGYMNGAVESGRRAAAEVLAVHSESQRS